jgi:CRP-like cAMP-binding protein
MSLTVVEKVIFLQNVDVFGSVSSEQLSYVAAIADVVSFLEGDDIYAANDVTDALYVVIDGRVRLHRDGEEIMTAGPKEAFGTWALLDDEPRVATATVVEDARLLRVDRDDFMELLTDHSEITQGLFKTVVGRMRGLLGRVESDRFQRPQ